MRAQPARPSTLYPVSQAVPVPGQPGALEWTIHVGVGDRYDLALAYRLPASAPVRVSYELLDADNRVICHRTLEFAPTAGASESGVLRLRACVSINAGAYRVRLAQPGSTPLTLVSLEVE